MSTDIRPYSNRIDPAAGTDPALAQTLTNIDENFQQLYEDLQTVADVADSAGGSGTDTGITELTGDVLAGPGSGSQGAVIGSHAVTGAKFRQSAGRSVVGVSGSSTADVADITAGSDKTVLARSSTLQFITAAALLEFLGTAAQGDIIYRNATGFVLLPAGTNGNFLKTQGAAADPLWAPVTASLQWSLISSNSPSAVNHVDFTSLGAYSEILVIVRNMSAAISVSIGVQVSVSGTFKTASGDYVGVNHNNKETAQTFLTVNSVPDSSGLTGIVHIHTFGLSGAPHVARGLSNFASSETSDLQLVVTTSALDGIRVMNGGSSNFSVGTIYVYGR